MKPFLCILVAIIFFSHCDASTWSDLYQYPYTGNPTAANAIACANATSPCYVAGSDYNNTPSILLFTPSSNTLSPCTIGGANPFSFMAVDVAGSVVVAGGPDLLSPGLWYATSPTSFSPSSDPWTLSSAVNNIRAQPFGVMAVGLSSATQISLSSNGGQNFTNVNVGVTVPAGATVRYGAMVDRYNWYVTFGSHPPTFEEGLPQHTKRITANWVQDMKTGKTYRKPYHSNRDATGNGYAAVIAKTANSGWSWQIHLIDNTSSYYLNAIDCWNSTLCVAVGEGFDFNPGIKIFQTVDGVHWNLVFQRSSDQFSYSLKTARYVSATEVWAAGGADETIDSHGVFFKSVNGGSTWAMDSMVDNIITITSLEMFGGGNTTTSGYAVGLTVNSLSTVLKYS